MARLTITDRRERALVAAADAMLWPAGLRRLFHRRLTDLPRRILCLRLERVGDLLMTGPALADLRAMLPQASIDLAVGSWNREVAAALPGIDRVETLDAAWLARGSGGSTPLALVMRAARWRSRHYDLAINFEPDIRTNIALAAAGATRCVGFSSGGGGALLDLAIDYDTAAHTIDNARRLVHAALGRRPESSPGWKLQIPEAHRVEAAHQLAPLGSGTKIGMHVSGGRAIKQWPEQRFRDVARHLVERGAAGVVLTGTPADRAQVEVVRSALPAGRVIDLCGNADLLASAAVIEQLDLFVTGDTGPLHLANAVGTPVVAIFGPSDPARYGPRGSRDIVVRIDLPCSPCNRIRLPPARCIGHTPDCLAGIEVARVLAAIDEVLNVEAAG